MDAAALWQRYQDWLYYNNELQFYVDISRMSFTDEDVASLQPKFEKAFTDMVALEKGAIANPDENRMVGHYWLRNSDLAPNDALKRDIVETLDKIKTFAHKVHDGEIRPPQAQLFTDVLSIGIGGSALGPQFVSEALSLVQPKLNIHFIDNTDPAGVDRTLAKLKDRLSSTLVITISKSGGTPETRNGMLEVKNAFEVRGLNFSQQAVAITGEGSRLDEQAKREGWLARFPMHDWVGGRTSEMSAVGLLPAALQGIDIQAMLDGAKAMDSITRTPSLKDNPAALLSLAWYVGCEGKGAKDMVILPYKDSLLLFSRYLQQLVMESLGKQEDLNGNRVFQGIAVYGNKGSTDQHAYVQQLREGVNNFFMTFIEVLQDRESGSFQVEPGITSGDYLSGLLQGTRQALFENRRESITVTIPVVTPHTVGALIALYERAVGFYASLVNVNAYHQPGVEAGKKAAASVLDLQSQIMDALKTSTNRDIPLPKLVEMLGCSDRIESVYKIVRHLAANNRGITISGDLGKPIDLVITTL
ncbi:MAG: glucose-6-phosphate isomerase [Symploca sp. SIO2B6]|nr:glucose-6-phosphate isomerase [Symploca sp. SIO2B6]